jgi:hypothetical protein
MSNLVKFDASVGWFFYDLSLIEFTALPGGMKYSIPNFQFGLVLKDQSDPTKVYVKSSPGDYLFQEANGSLSIVNSKIGKYYVPNS